MRDALLGRPSHDVNLVLPGGVFELARDMARAFGGTCFVLDQERETSRVLLRSEAGEPLSVDLARLRAPGLPEDLALRDFTINAMAAEIRVEGGPLEIIDPLGGQGDLAGRLVAAVSDRAFLDDPLRTLRGVRLAVELGFDIGAGTRGLIRRDAGLLAGSAAERVRDELARILGAPGAWQHLRLMASLDLLRPVLPEAQALAGVGQSEPHYLDVFDHTRAVLAHAEGLLAAIEGTGHVQATSSVSAPVILSPACRRGGIWYGTKPPACHSERMSPQSPSPARHSEESVSGFLGSGCASQPALRRDASDEVPAGEESAAASPKGLPVSAPGNSQPAASSAPYSLSPDPVQAAPPWQWAGVAAALGALRRSPARPSGAASGRGAEPAGPVPVGRAGPRLGQAPHTRRGG